VSQEIDATASRWWVGIDVGGTFTDVVAADRLTGEARDHKVLTTKGELQRGVLQAISELGIPMGDIEEIVHGHTAGINAILSRDGAKTALIATEGHKDLLDIGRMDREFGPRFYDPTWLRPHQERPIIARRDRYGVTERTAWDGSVLVALNEDRLRAIAADIRQRGTESVAICFVNAYLNREHEERAAAILSEELPGTYIQTSSLYPVIKEHERTTTVALDAYVGPIVTRYLKNLSDTLQSAGFKGSLWIMTMNGGVGSVAQTSKAPVFQLVSGPVGGVSGAVTFARQPGLGNLITMDVGGTSTDVAAIRAGQTPLTDLWAVEHGLTMTMPVVDVLSVGSGAGSIIHLDASGALRVGPESAGSTPGPACYGLGGERPTVTDACVMLGILQPDLFAGGAIKLNRSLSEKALNMVAKPLGLSAMELANAAYQLACSDMAGSIRSITTYRGLDPREFSLLAFGAAGPMMAGRVAQDLGAKSLVVPKTPGVFSAAGLLSSDLRVTKAGSPMTTLRGYGADNFEKFYLNLERQILDELAEQGVARDAVTFERAFFAMYAGQSWDNRIQLAAVAIDSKQLQVMEQQVHDLYLARYGFSAADVPIMVTSLEVTGIARRGDLPTPTIKVQAVDPLLRTVPLYFGGQSYAEVPVWSRHHVNPGERLPGPALVVEDFATTFVPPQATWRVHELGHVDVTFPRTGATKGDNQ